MEVGSKEEYSDSAVRALPSIEAQNRGTLGLGLAPTKVEAMHGHLMSREYRDIFKEIRMQIIREQLSKIRYHQNLLKEISEFLVQTKF